MNEEAKERIEDIYNSLSTNDYDKFWYAVHKLALITDQSSYQVLFDLMKAMDSGLSERLDECGEAS